jgi:hypothetical protein
MKPCATSPTLQFCPNQGTIRRGLAKQYDYALGLSGTPGAFTPTFKGLHIVAPCCEAPFTVNSAAKVDNLNADMVDFIDGANIVQGTSSDDGSFRNNSGEQTFFDHKEVSVGSQATLLYLPDLVTLVGSCDGDIGAVHFTTNHVGGVYVVSTRLGSQAWTIFPGQSLDVTADNGVMLLQFEGGVGHGTWDGQKHFLVRFTVDSGYSGHCFFMMTGSLQTT